VFQLKLYGVVPPSAVAVALPLFPPLQLTALLLAMEAESACAGWVITAFTVVWQPRASVMVQV
jgi:hypothetical protein